MTNKSFWSEITSFQNLLDAFHLAAMGKRSQPSVTAFELRLEANFLALHQELCEEAFRPGCYPSHFR